MKDAQPVLTTATVVILALALLVGRNLVPIWLQSTATMDVMSKAGEALDVTSEFAAAPPVAVPNARDGTHLERRERQPEDRGLSDSKTLGLSNAFQNQLTEEEFFSALDQDLEPWEREPVQAGGVLGLQKSAVVHRGPSGSKTFEQSNALQNQLTEEEFFSALNQDLEPWEREPAQAGGVLGLQKSAVVHRGPSGSKTSEQSNALQNQLTEEEFLSALDQDLEPWEREPVQIGGALGLQKSSVLLANHRHTAGK